MQSNRKHPRDKTRKENPFLKKICPEEQMSSSSSSSWQTKLQPADYRGSLPLYQWLQTPRHLEDIICADDDDDYRMSIFCENGTVLCLGYFHIYSKLISEQQLQQQLRRVSFTMEQCVRGIRKIEGAIFGETDTDIAETATWFWSLKYSATTRKVHARQRLEIHVDRDADDNAMFDFAALQPTQLAYILNSNHRHHHHHPIRQFHARGGLWNRQQSIVLATQSYSMELIVGGRGGMAFDDGGTAFVEALEARQSVFGSLDVVCDDEEDESKEIAFSRHNLQRLLKLDSIVDTLTVRPLLQKELLFLPFSAKVKALHYQMEARLLVRPEDFNLLNIVTKDLDLVFYLEDCNYDKDWDMLLISFLNRVTELGHFQRLGFSLRYHYDHQLGESFINSDSQYAYEKVQPVAEALIRAIHANPALTCLDLGHTHWLLNWCPHMPHLFQALDNHPSMRTFVVTEYPPQDGAVSVEDLQRDYSLLRDFLSRNDNITVWHRFGFRCSDGSSIDQIYRDRYDRASAKLVNESPSMRALLVATALVESASEHVLHTASLLFHHVDLVCEFVEDANL